jgi:ZIP family zinc transporter
VIRASLVAFGQLNRAFQPCTGWASWRVLTAVLFGLAASSALVIGSLVGARWSPPKRVTGVLLAFASGALISALAFELFEEAFTMGGPARAGIGLLAGAATFVAVDTALDNTSAASRDPTSVKSLPLERGAG